MKVSLLTSYFKRHPRFFRKLILDLSRVYLWKISGKRIVTLVSSCGIGDYLWIRSYFHLLQSQGYKVIVLINSRFADFAQRMDSNNVDIFREFDEIGRARKIEKLFFDFFRTDYFVDFWESVWTNTFNQPLNFIRYKKKYSDIRKGSDRYFYREMNNLTISQLISLPDDFKHTLPILGYLINEESIKKITPYIVLTQGGRTQGILSESQVVPIIKEIICWGYSVFYNGDYTALSKSLSENYLNQVINGYDFPLYEYPDIIKRARLTVTVNTSIYQMAVLLKSPCVVISANDYNTIDFTAKDQRVVFNDSLQEAYSNNALRDYIPVYTENLQTISSNKIIVEIQRLLNQ